jgi:hypothetical protein
MPTSSAYRDLLAQLQILKRTRLSKDERRRLSQVTQDRGPARPDYIQVFPTEEAARSAGFEPILDPLTKSEQSTLLHAAKDLWTNGKTPIDFALIHHPRTTARGLETFTLCRAIALAPALTTSH